MARSWSPGGEHWVVIPFPRAASWWRPCGEEVCILTHWQEAEELGAPRDQVGVCEESGAPVSTCRRARARHTGATLLVLGRPSLGHPAVAAVPTWQSLLPLRLLAS